MKLRELLDLLDPMTPLRVLRVEEGWYYACPMDYWKNPEAYQKDLSREVIKLDPEILNEDPVLMVALETEAHIKYREKVDKMFRPNGEVKETD